MQTQSVGVVGGGQSGLAAARAVREAGLHPLVLEASDRPVGSWPGYYDSLTLFSPAHRSSLPGMPFPGDPHGYPHRDEVVAYLADYAARLDVDIRTGHKVTEVVATTRGFEVRTVGGEAFDCAAVIAASGGFGRPHRPDLPGLDAFEGTVLHSSQYRRPEAFDGQRVVVVGGGNSAVQIAIELAEHARVSLATRHPLRFMPQLLFGRDMHVWLKATGLDTAGWARPLLTSGKGTPVLDTGTYRATIATGNPDRRPMFRRIDESGVTWADGTHEKADTILLATGYRPELSYLEPLGALDESGLPRQRKGLSVTHARLGYVGLEWQRSFASATLRGVGADAAYVVRHLRTQLKQPGSAAAVR